MKPGIVQKIFKDHFEAYRKTRVLGRRQYHAAGSIMTCRTSEKGYHIDACPNRDYEVLMHNSCKHRSCPLCGSTETQFWLERRKRHALNCRYFYAIITMSHDLHPIWRYNRKIFTNRMMQGAWHTLRELLLDLKWLCPVLLLRSKAVTMYLYMLDSISAGVQRRIKEYDDKVVKIAYAHPDKHEKPHFSISGQTFVLIAVRS